MKASNIKTVVVECKMKGSFDSKEFDIDQEIFDDVLFEAATRFAEERIKTKNPKIAAILIAYNKKDVKNYDKHICYNTYFVIVNAGYHKKAEIMRKNFLEASGVDLQKDPIKGQNARPDDN